MRILVYGFGPYLKFNDNVTAKIVRALPQRPMMNKIVFPVRFHKGQFTNALKKYRPDLVLGLGQCSKGRLLRLESRAVNRRRGSKNERLRHIARRGPAALATNLTLKLARHARGSQDAGNYVCNFSMYVMLDYIRRRKLTTLFGFVHVPHDYPPEKAASIVRRTLSSSKFKPSVRGGRQQARQ
jgi:pyrrolidone-carboxylate peptidase